jgi:ABC-type Co2+ transport system permease subunit
MKKNMGTADRMIRVIVALVIVVLLVTKTLTGTLALILGILAAVFLLTSAIGFCPLYVLLGISTCGKKEKT